MDSTFFPGFFIWVMGIKYMGSSRRCRSAAANRQERFQTDSNLWRPLLVGLAAWGKREASAEYPSELETNGPPEVRISGDSSQPILTGIGEMIKRYYMPRNGIRKTAAWACRVVSRRMPDSDRLRSEPRLQNTGSRVGILSTGGQQ